MAEIIVSVVGEVFKCLLGPIGRQSGYLRNYSSNLENLNKEVEKLMDTRESIQQKVAAARKNGDEIEKSVEKWLIFVDKRIDEGEKLIKDKEEANKKCFMGLCPNLKKCYQLSKKAVTVEKAVVRFKEEAEKFEQISHRTVPEEAWLTSVKGYEAFDSRILTLKKIQNALINTDISIVGVYGMGGVGKTTLVKEVARQGKKDRLFEEVVFTEVSQAADTKKIQTEIAEKLGLELREDTESGRARRICARLKNEKKILIVLDNMWKYLDLETVGIPYGDDHKGCKVLLTARDRNVLLSMGSKDNFLIGVLNKEEAWRLFKKVAGDDVENRKLKTMAVEVAKTCGGLPVAITTIARALRNKTVPQWKNALRELQIPSSENFEGLPAEAYSTIELSYKYLKSEQLKKTFLLCSLIFYPFWTWNFFKYGMGLGIFQGVNTMEDARNKLYALVSELKDSCLLLENACSENLSMHDVVVDVAKSIAWRDQHAFSVRNEDVWKWPNKDTLEKCTAISLNNASIPELPEGLECPQLEFFGMLTRDNSVKIPENFFAGMRKLRVVDLTGMQIMRLPSSLLLLTSLQTLCLDRCVFEDVAIIGNLKNLEILSFIKSDIVQFPKELGQLTKLRLLDLRFCKLKVIAPHVISSLIGLEELYMSGCSVEWGVEGPNSDNATLDELMHLPHLSALEIDITNENILPEGLLSKKLSRYQISIANGYWYKELSKHESSRMLKLKLKSISICLDNLQVIKDVEYLCLDKLQGVENVLFKLGTNGFTELKYLLVQNNPEILCIFDSMERMPYDAFPVLESLALYQLTNLEKIYCGELKAESFKELNSINVESCGKLRNIFSLSTSKCLLQLQKIAIINCDNMEEIFAIKGENDANNNQVFNKIEFAQLNSLSLRGLPRLTHFYKVVEAQENLITSVSMQLFSKGAQVVLPNLEALELYETNVETIWHNEFPAMSSSCFRSLTRLIVRCCRKLKYIFSSSMVKGFEQLQHLEICDCMALKEIIAREEVEGATSFVFPRVTTLIISALPELRCFYPGMRTLEWPVLEKLEVYSCDKVKIFASELISFNQHSQPLFLVEKVFLNLEELKVNQKDIAIIWQNQFPEHVLGKLRFLMIKNDESPGFPPVFLERFHNLEKLELVGSSYTEIFSNEQVEIDVGKLAKIKNLSLSELHELNYLWEQGSKTDSILQSLEVLTVNFCQNLSNLWPSSASFQHLTELEVRYCEKLMNLMTSTTAKGLLQLVRMVVYGCSGMTEVVVVEAASDNVVFTKLKHLYLINLKRLTSFCSGKCTFKFSSLELLRVRGCPEMMNFTGGEVITPKVDVKYGIAEKHSHSLTDDLNRAIQRLHQQKLLEEMVD